MSLKLRPLLRDLGRVGSRELEDQAETHEPQQLVLRGGPVNPLPDHIRQALLAAVDEPDRRPSHGLPE